MTVEAGAEEATRAKSPKSILTGRDHAGVRSVIDAIGAPVTIGDYEADGTIRIFAVNRSAADFYGVAADRIEGTALDEMGLKPEGRAQLIRERYIECLERGKPIQYRDFSPVDTAHGRRWVHTTLTPLRDPEQKITRVMATIVDVTDLKRSEDQLAEALTKVLGGFVSICASCKKIRDDDQWQPVEGYISSRSETRFSHSMCPECAKRWYGELADE